MIILTRGNLRNKTFIVQKTRKIKALPRLPLVKLMVNCNHNVSESIIRVTLILNMQFEYMINIEIELNNARGKSKYYKNFML